MTQPSVRHLWRREDDMFDRCSRCGLVQGVLYDGHYTDACRPAKNDQAANLNSPPLPDIAEGDAA